MFEFVEKTCSLKLWNVRDILQLLHSDSGDHLSLNTFQYSGTVLKMVTITFSLSQFVAEYCKVIYLFNKHMKRGATAISQLV